MLFYDEDWFIQFLKVYTIFKGASVKIYEVPHVTITSTLDNKTPAESLSPFCIASKKNRLVNFISSRSLDTEIFLKDLSIISKHIKYFLSLKPAAKVVLEWKKEFHTGIIL